jgi:hypothetical protein
LDQEISEISRKPADKLKIKIDNNKNLDLKLTGTKIKSEYRIKKLIKRAR